MLEISSFSNPRFKHLKSLAKAKNRKQEGSFIAEGRPELDIALKSGLEPTAIIYCESYISYEAILELITTAPRDVLQLSKALFDDLVYQKVSGNFMAVFKSWDCTLENLSASGHLVTLEGIEKPGNLGAVLRTCDAAGIKNVIVSDSEIDLFNPNVIRNSRGAAFTVNVAFCTNQMALDFIKKKNTPSYAAAISESAESYDILENSDESVLIFGAESKGLSSFWLEHSDHHIMIPMRGTVDSLNLSVSLALIVYKATS